MKTINVGIIGLGTVGGGAAKALLEKKSFLQSKAGVSIRLAGVYDKDLKKAKKLGIPDSLIVKDAAHILEGEAIDIVCELIGGIHPAREIILKAFQNRKHVVTANKALLAECGIEIFNSAADNNCILGFEASVGGAIPIIKVLEESFNANRISTLYGIVNGTCNFVLSKMADDECSMEEALKCAKAKGIAESNPKLDIEGIDSSHKLSILGMICFGVLAKQKNIYVEGIKNFDFQDLIYARGWGYDIKLLAIAKKEKGLVELRVHPTLIPFKHLLSSVKYEDNAIFVKGDMIGESMLYGKGAGSYPAASSVLSDIIGVSKNLSCCNVFSKSKIRFKPADVRSVKKMDNLISRYYVRFSAIDKPGVLSEISNILARNKISIATVSQKERKKGQPVPIVMLTHDAKEEAMNKAIKEINRLSFIKKKTAMIRIESKL